MEHETKTERDLREALERADRLEAELAEAKRERDDARADAKMWRSRCHVLGHDVARAGIDQEKCEAWMDKNFGPSIRARASGCLIWMSGGHEWQLASGNGHEIAETIMWAADELNRDHWDILAEMAGKGEASR